MPQSWFQKTAQSLESILVSIPGEQYIIIATVWTALKAKIKCVFNRLYCPYGNLLYKNDDHNLFYQWLSICVIPLLYM